MAKLSSSSTTRIFDFFIFAPLLAREGITSIAFRAKPVPRSHGGRKLPIFKRAATLPPPRRQSLWMLTAYLKDTQNPVRV